MSTHNLQKSIVGLDKDIASCELLLSKVKMNISTKGRVVGTKEKHILTKERDDYMITDIPTSRTELTSDLQGVPRLINRRSISKQVKQKDLGKNSTSSGQVAVKTIRSTKLSRNRSRPSGYNRSEDMQHEHPKDLRRQAKSQLGHLLGTKQTLGQNKLRKSRLSWAEVLQLQSRRPITVGTVKYRKSYNKIKPTVISDSDENSPMKTRHYNTSLSHSESSESVCDLEVSRYTDKGIQCSLAKSIGIHVDRKSPQCGKYETRSSAGDSFSMFNPLRTLKFLVQELHEHTKKYYNDDTLLQRIMVDLEVTLMRIPKGVQLEDKSGVTTLTYSVPTREDGKCVSLKPNLKPVKPNAEKAALPPLGKAELDPDIQTHLKESCAVVENTVLQMEITIGQLQREKHQMETNLKVSHDKQAALEKDINKLHDQIEVLKSQVEIKNHHIDMVKGKEQEYLQTISIQRKSINDMDQTVSELTRLIEQLKEDNKALPLMQDAKEKMSELLIASQNKVKLLSLELKNTNKLSLNLQLCNLKLEKLKILNADKEHKLDVLAEEIMNIKDIVMGEVTKLNSELATNRNENSMNITLGPEILRLFEGKTPLCSSRTSNPSHSLPFDLSWLKISSILPAEQPRFLESTCVTELSLPDADKIVNRGFYDIHEESEVNLMEEHFLKVSQELTEMEADNEHHSLDPVDQTGFVSILSDASICADRAGIEQLDLNVPIPSPPHTFLDVEPGGMSQWTESLDITK